MNTSMIAFAGRVRALKFVSVLLVLLLLALWPAGQARAQAFPTCQFAAAMVPAGSVLLPPATSANNQYTSAATKVADVTVTFSCPPPNNSSLYDNWAAFSFVLGQITPGQNGSRQSYPRKSGYFDVGLSGVGMKLVMVDNAGGAYANTQGTPDDLGSYLSNYSFANGGDMTYGTMDGNCMALRTFFSAGGGNASISAGYNPGTRGGLNDTVGVAAGLSSLMCTPFTYTSARGVTASASVRMALVLVREDNALVAGYSYGQPTKGQASGMTTSPLPFLFFTYANEQQRCLGPPGKPAYCENGPRSSWADSVSLPNPPSVLNATCDFTTFGTRQINLPTVATGALPGVGATAGDTGFSIPLINCPASTQLSITFSDSNMSGNTTGVLKLGSGSGASGVGLQLLYNNTPVAVDGNTKVALGSSDALSSIPMTVRYYATSSTVSAGSVNAQATFQMSYP